MGIMLHELKSVIFICVFELMTSMRSVKDIRSDVANARFMSESMGRGTSVPRTNAL